jgi:hypothetical protein
VTREEARHFTPLLFRDGPGIHRAVALLRAADWIGTRPPLRVTRNQPTTSTTTTRKVVGELNSPGCLLTRAVRIDPYGRDLLGLELDRCNKSERGEKLRKPVCQVLLPDLERAA